MTTRQQIQHLLAAKCDLTGFIITTAITLTKWQVFAGRLFPRSAPQGWHVWSSLLIQPALAYLSKFTSMCSTLQIRLHLATRGNHKAVSVERFFCYLNKAVSIAKNDLDTLSIWGPRCHAHRVCVEPTAPSKVPILYGVSQLLVWSSNSLSTWPSAAPPPLSISVLTQHATLLSIFCRTASKLPLPLHYSNS